MTRAAKLRVGDLVARTEAPTVPFRVTSKFPTHVRILPYRRSGKEHLLFEVAGHWAGDGSIWTKTGTS